MLLNRFWLKTYALISVLAKESIINPFVCLKRRVRLGTCSNKPASTQEYNAIYQNLSTMCKFTVPQLVSRDISI